MAHGRKFIPPAPAVALAIAVLAVQGCAGSSGGMFGGSYTIAADDACGSQRQDLKAFQDYFFSSMVQGAAIGALTGGLAGGLIGGNLQGAAIGAGAGALVGGATGYYVAKQKANNDPVGLTNSVYQDVSTENSQIDSVSLAFVRLRDCRLRTAEAVKRDYGGKTVTREDAQGKLQRIRALFVEDVNFAEGLGSKMAQRGGEYQNASDQIVQMDPAAKQTLAQRQASTPRASGPRLVANEAARVRSAPSPSGAQVAALAPGESMTQVTGGNTPADWTHVQLRDGKTGFVASRLVRPAGSAAPSAAPPPHDAAGVAQLTESNQLKRKALSDEIAQAKSDANGSAFELSGSISLMPHWLHLKRA
jgi:hypothetical protein